MNKHTQEAVEAVRYFIDRLYPALFLINEVMIHFPNLEVRSTIWCITALQKIPRQPDNSIYDAPYA